MPIPLRPSVLAASAILGVALAGPIRAETADTVPQEPSRIAAIEKTLAGVTLPPGFAISFYARVPGARALAVAPGGGAVFVGTTEHAVYRIDKPAAGGITAVVRTFAPDIAFTIPNGVCFAPDGTLYVAEQNRILAFPDAATAAAPKPVTVVAQGALIPAAEQSDNHSARVCRIGPDGKLYVALGQPYNVPPREKLDLYSRLGMGGIVRMDRDGRNREVFARGIRNSVGLDFDPADGTLWFTDNQVDGMGDDVPAGEINHATAAGQNYGFPWYGGGHTRTLPYRAAGPPAGLVFPAVEEVAHAADLGMTFDPGASFPAGFKGAIFSAQHGSWNRSVPVGARVMVTPVRPDGSAGPSRPFAEGWLQPNGDYAGRPVDVAPLPDGSLLVSDDFAGAVYRISYRP